MHAGINYYIKLVVPYKNRDSIFLRPFRPYTAYGNQALSCSHNKCRNVLEICDKRSKFVSIKAVLYYFCQGNSSLSKSGLSA